MLAVGVAIDSTVIVISLLVIVAGFAQVASDVSVQVIISPSVSADDVKDVVLPTLVLPTFQS